MTDPTTPRPAFQSDAVSLFQGDCLDVLPTLPDNSVDLIVTDPPYFRVKKDAWDRQWGTPKLFLAWLDRVLAEFHRVLRPNGSLYVFASPQMAARVEVLTAERFNVVNSLVWSKSNEPTKALIYGPDRFRHFVPKSERIIFAEHKGSDNIAKGEAGYEAKCDQLRGFVFEPIRTWFRQAMLSAGLTPKDLNRAVGSSPTGGGMASHYVGDTGQWELPTPQHYAAIQDLAPLHFNRKYEELRTQYEDLRTQYEDLRRPFAVTADVPYTDVWDFPTVSHYAGKHPCEKPQALLRHIIAASSRPGAVVLDTFFGSGAVGEAAVALGRRCVAVEMSEHWVQSSAQRLGLRPVV